MKTMVSRGCGPCINDARAGLALHRAGPGDGKIDADQRAVAVGHPVDRQGKSDHGKRVKTAIHISAPTAAGIYSFSASPTTNVGATATDWKGVGISLSHLGLFPQLPVTCGAAIGAQARDIRVYTYSRLRHALSILLDNAVTHFAIHNKITGLLQ